MTVAETIKKFRKDLGLTQEELAAAVSVHVASVRNWEKGSIPQPAMKKTLSAVLGIPPELFEKESIDPLEEAEIADLQKALHKKTAALYNKPLDKISISVLISE